MNQKPEPLGNIVDSLMKSLGLTSDYNGWKTVGKWSEIVGPEIARISKAVRFNDGILTVVVEQDTWRQELEMQLDEVLTKIRRLPGGTAVKRVVLKAGNYGEK